MTTPDQLFEDIENYRAVLSTETDDGSPDNENTYGAIRNCIEALTMHAGGVVVTMTLTSDPSNSNNGIATDSSLAMTVDKYIGHLAVVLDGDGIGNIFYIQDNAATTITCYTELQGESGGINPNLYSSGVRAGDRIGIFYHFMTSGHNHDGKNSAPFASPDGYSVVCSYPFDASRTVLSADNLSWAERISFMTYIPSNASVLKMYANIRKDGIHPTYYRFLIFSGNTLRGASGVVTVATIGTTWQWIGPLQVNCSGFTPGWYRISVQGMCDVASTETSYIINSVTFAWFSS